MSSSPKYTQYRLLEEEEQRQREEKRRRAEQRAVEKRAAAERRRQEAFRREQDRMSKSVTEVLKMVATFRQSPAGRCVAESLGRLESESQRLAGISLPNRKLIANVDKQLARLRGELQQAVVQGRAVYDARQLQREAALLLKSKYQVAADRQGSRQFDPAGLELVESMLRQIETLLARRDLADVRCSMAELDKTFAQHRAQVQKQRSAFLARQQEARAVLEGLQQKLAELQADTTVQRWAQPAVVEVEKGIDRVTKAIGDGQFDFAMRTSQKLTGEAERILKMAEQQEEAHEEQEFIAEKTAAALRACGLQVSVDRRKCEAGKEEIVIRASGTEPGGTLDVRVPRAGAIEWSPSGFPMQVVPGTKGQPASVCDEAVKQIQKVQEKLRQLGVQTGAVTWPGQDPDLPIGAAKSTRSKPQHHPHSRVRSARR